MLLNSTFLVSCTR